MADEIVRTKEIDGIRACFAEVSTRQSNLSALEIGCGNGYLLSLLRPEFPQIHFTGIDYTEKMVDLAKSRNLADVDVSRGDVTNLKFPNARFDVVISERVIINLLDRADQDRAFAEVARVLKPDGWFLCIEAFTTPLANINAARTELQMPEIRPPHHNRWFSDEEWNAFTASRFEIVSPSAVSAKLPEPNFLSTHYFATRVFHDLLRPEGGAIRNTHFGRFFSATLPNYGDYAPVKFYILRRL